MRYASNSLSLHHVIWYSQMAEILLTLYTQLAASGHSNYLQGCIRLKCDINHLKEKVLNRSISIVL